MAVVERGPEEGVPFEAIPRFQDLLESGQWAKKEKEKKGREREGRTESLFSQARAAAFE